MSPYNSGIRPTTSSACRITYDCIHDTNAMPEYIGLLKIYYEKQGGALRPHGELEADGTLGIEYSAGSQVS